MIRAWTAIALLAGSLTFAWGFFYPVDATSATILASLGALLLCGESPLFFSRNERYFALALAAPVAFLSPWPTAAIPTLFVFGVACSLLSGSSKLFEKLSVGAILSSFILATQNLTLLIYASATAKNHDLPWPLPDFLALVARGLSVDAVADGSNVVLHSLRQTHQLGATWELLLDPITLCFFVGAVAFWAWKTCADWPAGSRYAAWLRGARSLALILAAWLPLRAGLLMAVYLHRVLRADPDHSLHAMNHFFAHWPLLLYVIAPMLAAWRWMPRPEESDSVELPRRGFCPSPSNRNVAAAAIAASLVGICVTAAVVRNPLSKRNEGRVTFVEKHLNAESDAQAVRPYDTTWYGELSIYNFSAAYAYLGQYYQMSRLMVSDSIDDATLAKCDVLVIKLPSERYSPEEVRAVQRFVSNGGGLMLIGDHTNLDRSSAAMNDITRPMGFIFRDDLLFSNERSAYDQRYYPDFVPHPAAQFMPPMDFAVSCSIDPGTSDGRPIIDATGLWSMPPDYNFDNYHPIPQHVPSMRYGAFVESWSAWYGKGRVVAFGDSTSLSSFALFQPGKAEFLVGVVEWLNHKNSPFSARPWFVALSLICGVATLIFVLRSGSSWLVPCAGIAFGWILASYSISGYQWFAMAWPKNERPLKKVVIDRITSDVLLSKGAFTQGKEGDEAKNVPLKLRKGEGYGLFEQWIGRLGYSTIRKEKDDVFSGDAIVSLCPDKPVSAAFIDKLKRFVENGGKLLVVDSPENANSTADAMLKQFGFTIKRDAVKSGSLILADAWPNFRVENAWEIVGGTPIAKLDGVTVGASIECGRGTVMAVGFGSTFNDRNMGDTWMVEPEPDVRSRYDAFYPLLRRVVENTPITAPKTAEQATPASFPQTPVRKNKRKPDLPMPEFGPKGAP